MPIQLISKVDPNILIVDRQISQLQNQSKVYVTVKYKDVSIF